MYYDGHYVHSVRGRIVNRADRDEGSNNVQVVPRDVRREIDIQGRVFATPAIIREESRRWNYRRPNAYPTNVPHNLPLSTLWKDEDNDMTYVTKHFLTRAERTAFLTNLDPVKLATAHKSIDEDGFTVTYVEEKRS
jgi:hypothetical protein